MIVVILGHASATIPVHRETFDAAARARENRSYRDSIAVA